MERRYEARLEEMLEDAEVSPEMLEGMLNRFRGGLASSRSRRHSTSPPNDATPSVHDRTAVGPQAQDRRGDRIPPRSETPGHPEVHRACALGSPALVRDAGRPSWRAVGGARRGPRVRSLGLPQKGRSPWAWRGSGAAGSGRSTTARWASTWVTCRGRSTRSSIRG